jgi:hypothetical protein
MMHGREKSDPAIVAGKPTNKAERSAAEPVERRAGTKGNANQQSMDRAQNRVTMSQALERIRKAATAASLSHPRWEPCAGIPHARICAGGGWQQPSLPRSYGEVDAIDANDLEATSAPSAGLQRNNALSAGFIDN